MIIKNWMQKNPPTIPSDMLASEAKALFDERRLPFISVVDDGRLRGILARRDIREAASSVTAAQSIHELEYFNTRLKVKDLMVRNPVTLSADDAVETALEKGERFGRSFFPILDGDRVVGAISDRDISIAFYQILGIDEKLCGLSVEIEEPHGNAIKKIVETLFSAGLEIRRLFTLKAPKTGKKRLLLRFDAREMEKAASTLEEKGYNIIERVMQK
ncbi:MAG: CBS domain-containing protein [Desulfobacterales bacterium]|nr:CBS domain-containing protein [Desulfobacterales bacterium]